MASTSCPLCDAWTVGFEYDLATGAITWYCLKCGHRWRRPERSMNVPKLVLGSAGISIGLLGLGVLVALKIADDCAKLAGLR